MTKRVIKLDDRYLVDFHDGRAVTSVHQSEAARYSDEEVLDLGWERVGREWRCPACMGVVAAGTGRAP